MSALTIQSAVVTIGTNCLNKKITMHFAYDYAYIFVFSMIRFP
jgi:hypothetical protein